jgi:hypothetical protein
MPIENSPLISRKNRRRMTEEIKETEKEAEAKQKRTRMSERIARHTTSKLEAESNEPNEGISSKFLNLFKSDPSTEMEHKKRRIGFKKRLKGFFKI